MKRLILAAIALPLTWAGAYAQGIHIGPGGVGIDTGPHHYRQGEVVRQYQDEDGCMVRVIRYHRPDGDVVTRRTRDCD